MPFDELRAKYTRQPMSDAEHELQQIRFGECLVNVPKKTVIQILLDEVLNPFYIFQIFSIAVFIWESYTIYAGCIFALSSIAIASTIYETRKNNEQIRRMAKYICEVEVMKQDQFGASTLIKKMSDSLVPGDIIKVPEGIVLPCDLVLVSGGAIMNEAILTGESIPVMKASLPAIYSDYYNIKECSKYTLYGGTAVIQTRPAGDQPVLALVTNTGFLTTKGSLVRDILYPKEIKFKFYEDGMKFVAIMASIAVLGFCCICPILVIKGEDARTFIDRSLNLIVIAVPPALPAAMSCGMVFAI